MAALIGFLPPECSILDELTRPAPVKRRIGFATWDPEWEMVRDEETFAQQEDRLHHVLALPDEGDIWE